MVEEKKNFFDELEENIALIPITIAVLLTLATFVMQAFASQEAVVLVQQLSYYSYSWVCCICLAICARDKNHIRATLLEKALPENVRRYFGLFCDLLGLIIMAGMLYGTFRLINATMAEHAMNNNAAQLPLSVAYFAPLLGFAAGIVRQIMGLVKGGNK